MHLPILNRSYHIQKYRSFPGEMSTNNSYHKSPSTFSPIASKPRYKSYRRPIVHSDVLGHRIEKQTSPHSARNGRGHGHKRSQDSKECSKINAKHVSLFIPASDYSRPRYAQRPRPRSKRSAPDNDEQLLFQRRITSLRRAVCIHFLCFILRVFLFGVLFFTVNIAYFIFVSRIKGMELGLG